MERLSEIGIALLDVLKSKNGPLYVGITGIGLLVLGWKFLDENYRVIDDRLRIEPLSGDEFASTAVVIDNNDAADDQELLNE